MCVWCMYQHGHHVHTILFDDVHVPQTFFIKCRLLDVDKGLPMVGCSA